MNEQSSIQKFLGEFEELILLAVTNLGDNAYGVSIAEAIEEATGKRVSIGALYTSLARLEEKSYVSTRIGEPTEERGGRAKKFYKIEGLGQKALNDTVNIRNRFLSKLQTQPA
jgi:PadR family transcriptional regulator, regulatory protein PadR